MRRICEGCCRKQIFVLKTLIRLAVICYSLSEMKNTLTIAASTFEGIYVDDAGI